MSHDLAHEFSELAEEMGLVGEDGELCRVEEEEEGEEHDEHEHEGEEHEEHEDEGEDHHAGKFQFQIVVWG